ncbi:Predicted dehydrogenase [Halopelagius inordinatus]|uniref:Predicted dehydrogenase n=1 Tax=Halopelagius inordinatus TaxID=553467 RepID=A0A1I2NLZ7_9EURY|nr:Gfo/Idh/MocA family oxidoreductase [Halopelagius inordinatus]SFG02301.1 Predicted dehydrogenase [Halopelagius inordinatus]
MTHLSVVAIGLGSLGRLESHIANSIDGVDIVGGADPAEDARATFESELHAPAYGSHEELLDDVDADAAIISSPHTLHFEHAMSCLERGVHVHLEKPMVTDLGDARALAREAEARDCVLAVGYQRHFDDRFREMRRIIDEGRIGTPHMATCHLEQVWIDAVGDGWRGNPALSGGGQLYDSGSHLLDSLLWTTRSTPVSVAATVDSRGADVDVNSALAVTLERGDDRMTASVGVSGAGESGPAPGEMLSIWGTEGSVSFDGEIIRVTEDGATHESTPAEPSFEDLTERKLGNFFDAARGDAESEIPPADAVKVTALTEAAYESAESGRRLAVDAGLEASVETPADAVQND